MRTTLIASAVLVALASPSLAQDAPATTAPTSPPATTTLACTNSGMRYSVGEFACIAACHGQRRLARCDSVSEQPKWTYVSESCPSAMLNQPWPSAWSEVPADALMSPKPVHVNRSAIPVDDKLVFARFTDVLASVQ
jgi:hypothetical protein